MILCQSCEHRNSVPHPLYDIGTVHVALGCHQHVVELLIINFSRPNCLQQLRIEAEEVDWVFSFLALSSKLLRCAFRLTQLQAEEKIQLETPPLYLNVTIIGGY